MAGSSRSATSQAIRQKGEGRWVTLIGRSTSQMVSLPKIVVADPVVVKQFVHIGGEQQAAAIPVTSHLRWAVATFFR